MIIITKAKLRFLQTGRPVRLETPNTGRYHLPDWEHPDRSYAVGLTHNKTICRVEVTQIERGAIIVRLVGQDPVNLLALRSQYGYTSNRAKALRDEPEAVDRADVARLTRVDQERRQQERQRFAQQVIRHAEELEAGADRLTRKRLRSMKAIASSLDRHNPAA